MATAEFNQMLLQNTDFLKPFAVTLTKDQETAKDLLQETMYRALPPGIGCFSNTITSHPAFAMKEAAERPAKPLPMITHFLATPER